MRIRVKGLVQLKNGDAVSGMVARLGWMWRTIRIDGATAYSASTAHDPQPAKMDGIVWVPKRNIAFVQELTTSPALHIEVPVVVQTKTALTPAGRALDEE